MMVCEASGRFWSANLGGTAGVYLFITLVPYNRRGQEFFILFEKGATIMSKHVPYRIYLPEERIPRQWYNLRADMKEQPAPFLNPGTMQPLKLEELYPIFCEELAQQEFDSTNRYIDIPEEIVEYYKTFRPSPLIRAYNLEKELGTPAKIYCKFEGNNTSGSHKLNSAIAQAYYAKKQGLQGLTTETGAGQWGTALSMACAYFHIPLTVYMVKTSFNQKPYRKSIIETFGAEIIPSPSDTTKVGREIGCAGGGSNLGGLIAPFMQDRLTGKANPYFIAVEPASCPSMTRGRYAYDFCDTGKVTPLAKMYTLGCEFQPSPNHAGGLRYHGMSPILSKLYHDGFLDEARAVEQTKVFDAAIRFSRCEGILPAPESSHAIYAAIEEALKCKASGEAKTILFGLTGTGYFDMAAYASYFDRTMSDSIPTDEQLEKGFQGLPKVAE